MDSLKPSSVNSSPLTPVSFLRRAAAVYGDSISIIYDSTVYTWSETYRRCLRLAAAISAAAQIHPGDVVSVVSPNVPALYELHFAVPMAGAVLNCINTRLNPSLISSILIHSESKLLFIHSSIVHLLPSFTSPVPPLVLISENLISSPIPKSFIFDYESLVLSGDPEKPWIQPKSEWDPIVLNYTSGTTASPKGVVHSHRGIYTVVLDTLLEWSVPKQPTYLWTLPMFHANGWSFPWGMAAVGGTNICLLRFDSSTIFDSIAAHKVTHFSCAPVVLTMISNHPNPPSLPYPVHVLTAGSAPQINILRKVERMGFVVAHGYGLTETGGVVATCVWNNKWDDLNEDEKIKIKAKRLMCMACVEGVKVIKGGEIVVRGPSVMLGYLKNEDESRRVMKDGWFHTGDLGIEGGDGGYVEIKDRWKDVIISGGENISSLEVERVVGGYNGVEEVAAVAKPDEYWGETVCVFVKWSKGVKEEEKEEKRVVEYCRKRLPGFMAPKCVVGLDELPKTATGKVQKFLLRDLAKRIGPGVAIGNKLRTRL